ncbi:MAG: sterol desaturase family protein [Planctomycetota bacterium]|nr:sterol desaturase family protein [Planctomycetota bacterium]
MDVDPKLLVAAGSLVLFWTWESWRPFFGQREGRLRHAGRNLLLALLNTLVLTLGFALILAQVADHGARSGFGLLRGLALPPALALVGTILLLDAVMYVWHRANHAVPLLWRFHRTHHSDPHMDVTTATRFHLGEHAGAFLVRLATIYGLGLELSHVLLYDVLLLVMTQFHHADISLGRLDAWLRVLLVTPDMHKVHHSQVPAETDSNYGVLFSWWDRLGRSHRTRTDLQALHFGLRGLGADRWQSLRGMLATPFAPLARRTSDSTGSRRKPDTPG